MSDICKLCLLSTAIVMCAVLITASQAQSADKFPEALQGSDGSSLLVDDVRGDAFRELERLRQEEAAMIKIIQDARSRMTDIKTQKRAHVQCLVNLVACYRKRK